MQDVTHWYSPAIKEKPVAHVPTQVVPATSRNLADSFVQVPTQRLFRSNGRAPPQLEMQLKF